MWVRDSRAHDNLNRGDGRMKEQKGGRISHRVVAEGMSCWGGEKLMEGRVNIFRLEKIVEQPYPQRSDA